MKHWLAIAAALLAACGDEPEPVPPLDAQIGDFFVHVEARPPRLVITDWQGTTLLDGLPDGLAVGHAEETYEMQFGAFKIEEGRREVPAAARLAELREVGGQVSFLMLDTQGVVIGRGEVEAGAEPGVLVITLAAEPGAGADADRVSYSFDCAPDEHFLGFGGQSFDVDHRGQNLPLWVQEDGIGKQPTDDYTAGVWILEGRRHSTHTPMPIYLSSRGYALLLESDRRSVFDMCAERADAVRVESWEPTMRLVLFGGPSPTEAVARLTRHVGRPPRPPAFTFAPWLDALYGSDNVRRVAAKLRAEAVPSSVIWSEDWRGGNQEGDMYVLEEDWELDRALYPDFEQVAGELHAAGFKWLVYYNTFLDSTAGTFNEAVAGGYTIEDASGEPYIFTGVKFHDSSMADLSPGPSREWVKQKLADGIAVGADGWMADFAEWLPHDAVLASGEDPLEAHNRYPIEWQRVNAEVLAEAQAVDGVERLTFVRSGWVGSQPLVQVMWAGDQQTDFSVGDGYPSVIPMGIGLGVTGFPYYGHDIGGYMSQGTEPTSEELWYRWVTLGALSPVMRTHHGRAALYNWNWETDAAATAHFKRWAELHIRLLPYFDAMVTQVQELGTPIFRPHVFDYPTWAPGWSLVDQYMLGDRILVAPVVVEGATSRELQLPGGTFYPLLGGAAVTVPASGGSVTVQAPMSEIPALVPAGTVLVLLAEGVQTLFDAEPLLATDAAREVWLWPAGQGSFEERAGQTYTWDAAGLTGPIASASFEGAALPLGETFTVTGNGTLVLNGGEATLVVAGAAPGRVLVVRVQGL